MSMLRIASLLTTLPCLCLAADPVEQDYYRIEAVPNPDNFVLEVGAIELGGDGAVYAATRRGEVFRITEALGENIASAKVQKFATGMHECLGAAWKDGALYVTQRPEITRLKDENGDGRADTYETFCDAWGHSGDYHEYDFGSTFDRDGNIWVATCLTGSFSSAIDFRGWALRIGPDGKMTPVCGGLRSPGGVGFNAEGDVFYTDNQGPWNGSSSLKWLKPGSFQGHPDGNRWYAQAPGMGKEPVRPNDNSRMVTERKRVEQLVPPAVMLPHGRVGQSPTAIVCDTTGGKFGPFQGQLFIGEQCYSNVQRVCLEKVNGIYQGAVIPWLSGFGSGIIGVEITPDGRMFAGGSDRGWGSRGGKPFCMDRIVWTGKVPFEVLEVRAQPDGFTLNFTQPVEKAAAGNPASYACEAWTWAFRAEYGGPEVDQQKPAIRSAEVAPDGKSVRLRLEKLIHGHVHLLKMDGVKSESGLPLLHKEAYYTLNEIPTADR